MANRFKNKLILITGSTRGIGNDVALAFAREGGMVVINSRNVDEVKNIVANFHSLGFAADGFAADVGDWRSAQDMIGYIGAYHKTLDVVINNAGISQPISSISNISVEDWDNIIRVNLSGAFYLTKAALGLMQETGGVIINISSMAYMLPSGSPNAAYSASKGGLISFTKHLANEAAPKVRVNAICPWYTKTKKLEKMLSENGSNFENLSTRNPLKRIALPVEISALATFLASDEASFITGQVINVSGGVEL